MTSSVPNASLGGADDRPRGIGPVSRRELLVTVAASALAVLMLWDTFILLPLQWFVTLIHEAGHAVVAMAFGNPVDSVTINTRGGGLTRFKTTDPSTLEVIAIGSAGYLGAAFVGGALLEMCRRLRSGRVVLAGLAVVVAAIALAWVPWTTQVDPASTAITGTARGDGRFTIAYSVAAVAVFVGLAFQPLIRVRRIALAVVATGLCLGAVEDLRSVLSISRQGGLSDAAAVANATPLPSWLWATLWLLVGVGACALGLWSALSRSPRPSRVS